MLSSNRKSELTYHTESTPLTSRVQKQMLNSRVKGISSPGSICQSSLLQCGSNKEPQSDESITRNPQINEFITNRSKSTESVAKSLQKNEQITEIPIRIRKKVKKPHELAIAICGTEIPKVDASKYRAAIRTKQSQSSNQHIKAYGIATSKGFKNSSNLHHIALHLGHITNVSLIESYDGNATGKFVHENYPLNLISIATQQIQRSPEKYIREAYEKTQAKICQFQHEQGDTQNSGCSLLSAVITDQLISVANCGCSVAICLTHSGQLLTLNSQHHTSNQNQLDRISSAGGKIYQSVFQVSNSQLSIDGPVRVSPSGLVYTRTLGKYHEHKKEYLLSKSNNDDFVSGSRLMWQPQIRYINRNQVLWLGLFSESVIKNLNVCKIRNIVNQQHELLRLKSNLHDIAECCSKTIVKEVLNTGTCDSVSATILFLGQFSTQLPDPMDSIEDSQQLGVPIQGYQQIYINRNRLNVNKGYSTNRAHKINLDSQ